MSRAAAAGQPNGAQAGLPCTYPDTMVEASLDRVAGALLGLAAGDALGAGYEFTKPAADAEIGMVGGGSFGWEPGEWTDDTQMALCIAQVTARGRVDLDGIGEAFLAWARGGPTDIGVQTGAVLRSAGSAADLPQRATAHFARNPQRGAGNGSRTGRPGLPGQRRLVSWQAGLRRCRR